MHGEDVKAACRVTTYRQSADDLEIHCNLASADDLEIRHDLAIADDLEIRRDLASADDLEIRCTRTVEQRRHMAVSESVGVGRQKPTLNLHEHQ